jgi:hypothetical protein
VPRGDLHRPDPHQCHGLYAGDAQRELREHAGYGLRVRGEVVEVVRAEPVRASREEHRAATTDREHRHARTGDLDEELPQLLLDQRRRVGLGEPQTTPGGLEPPTCVMVPLLSRLTHWIGTHTANLLHRRRGSVLRTVTERVLAVTYAVERLCRSHWRSLQECAYVTRRFRTAPFSTSCTLSPVSSEKLR